MADVLTEERIEWLSKALVTVVLVLVIVGTVENVYRYGVIRIIGAIPGLYAGLLVFVAVWLGIFDRRSIRHGVLIGVVALGIDQFLSVSPVYPALVALGGTGIVVWDLNRWRRGE